MKLRLGGLHLQLLGIIFIPFLLVLLGIAIAGIRIHQGAMRQLVAERDERAVRAAAGAISEQMHHREAALLGLSKRLGDGISPEVVIEQADFLYADFDAGLAVLGQEGEVLSTSVPRGDWDRRPTEVLMAEAQVEEVVFSEPFDEDGTTLALVAARNGDRVAVGAFSIREVMRSTLLGFTRGKEGYLYFLTDPDGRIVWNEGVETTSEDVSDHLGVEAALRGEVGSSFIPTEGGEHVVAFSPVQPNGWALILEEPWEAVTSPLLDLSLAAPLALVPAVLVTLAGLWFGARQVIRPLRELQAQAEELAKSNYQAIETPVGGIAEIQSLQGTLIWMTQNIRGAQTSLQRYIGAITDAQEEERRRLARELHDETIQDLIAIDQQIQMTRMELEEAAKVEGQLVGVRREVGEAIRGLRRVIRALRPIYLEDLGLVPALEMLAKETERDHAIQVVFRIQGEVRRLQPSAELAIYRIVQEAMSNSLRHSGADRIDLDLEVSRDTLRISVRDDGVGFEPPDRPEDVGAQGHFGLMGMSERAELIGARLEFRSRPGDGTQIWIELPLPIGGG
jgi:signal transduction histidine kinase